MPASSANLYHMQDAKNNFEAIRPAPICSDTNMLTGHCQTIHISTNCYYGYHDAKNIENNHYVEDCEMMEVPQAGLQASNTITSIIRSNPRKRSADACTYPQTKRLREEIKRKFEPETIEKEKLDTRSEELEDLYWNLHGGNFFHLLQCP